MLSNYFQSNIGLSDWLDVVSGSFLNLLPELALAITLVFLILFDLLFDKHKSIGLVFIALSGLTFVSFLLIKQWQPELAQISFFDDMLKQTNFAIVIKLLFSLAAIISVMMLATDRSSLMQRSLQSSEHLVMLMTILLGSFFMTMTMNLVLIYLSIELVSIASYLITALLLNKKRAEAALKYLIFGAVASAFMLYGMSWLYGFTGTLQLDSDTFLAGLMEVPPMPLTLALLLTLVGLLFKLGAFPMHIWSPDVYEAAPTPVVSFFSVVPKIAAISVIFRIVQLSLNSNFDWALVLTIVSMASMVVGNFSAIWQKDVKRMLAYSSIAHAGFLLIGIIAQSETGNESMLIYAIIYAAMNYAAFWLVQLFEGISGTSEMSGWKGYGRQYPYLGVLFLITMVSLTGLPPTAGFNAKLFVFTALWESYISGGDQLLLWLFIFGLFNTVVSLFYYLKIPYLLFFKESSTLMDGQKVKVVDIFLGTILVSPLLVLFFKADWFVDLMNTVNFTF
jgi:NADH-quinone oxidoreductase subunit N